MEKAIKLIEERLAFYERHAAKTKAVSELRDLNMLIIELKHVLMLLGGI